MPIHSFFFLKGDLHNPSSVFFLSQYISISVVADWCMQRRCVSTARCCRFPLTQACVCVCVCVCVETKSTANRNRSVGCTVTAATHLSLSRVCSLSCSRSLGGLSDRPCHQRHQFHRGKCDWLIPHILSVLLLYVKVRFYRINL